jgi:hypothetical protein
MSAYLVNPEHIAEIAKIQHWAKFTEIINPITGRVIFSGPTTATVGHVATILAEGNIESLKARYPDVPIGDWIHNIDSEYGYKDTASFYADKTTKFYVNDPSLLNMIRCLRYQSCEVDNYESTDAYWVLHRLEDALIRKITQDLAYEYEEDNLDVVEWTYRTEDYKKAVFHG